jgi:UDP-N-acetylmuramoylalanine--D-glutamate ligase
MSLVREKVKAIVCLGVTTKKLLTLGNVVDMMIEVSNMNDAVRMAQKINGKGDTVLSPACASFDLFENHGIKRESIQTSSMICDITNNSFITKKTK